MQEDVKNGKNPWRRSILCLLLILVVIGFFTHRQRNEFDLNSGRTRYTFSVLSVPLYWRTSETEFSRLVKAEGITTGDEPPQWVTDVDYSWINCFPVRPGHPHHRIIQDCDSFCSQLEASRKFIPEAECRSLIDLQWQRVQKYNRRHPEEMPDPFAELRKKYDQGLLPTKEETPPDTGK